MVSDSLKPTGTWPAIARARSLMGAEASSRSSERDPGPDDADEEPFDDERPAHVAVGGADEAHDLDLLGA